MVSPAGALFLLLVSFSCLYGLHTFFKRTSSFWIKVLFPLGYALYNTKLGYAFHLRKLKKMQSQESHPHSSSRSTSPHSITSPTSLSLVTIVPVAVLDDNYSYLIIDQVSDTAVAVDPSDPTAVMEAVASFKVKLVGVLTTHKHWDHSGGNALLRRRFSSLPIYGGAIEKVPSATHPVQDREVIKFGRMSFEAILTPGHTKGHMMYKLMGEPPCLFSGDHLFICGNGMMFEGSPEVMLSSIQKAMLLPKNTLLYPGHEYALRDVKFASQLLPTNTELQRKWQWVKQQRERGLSTVPSILSEELQYNPFMQTSDPALAEALGLPTNTPPSRVLAELRKQKNAFSKTNF